MNFQNSKIRRYTKEVVNKIPVFYSKGFTNQVLLDTTSTDYSVLLFLMLLFSSSLTEMQKYVYICLYGGDPLVPPGHCVSSGTDLPPSSTIKIINTEDIQWQLFFSNLAHWEVPWSISYQTSTKKQSYKCSHNIMWNLMTLKCFTIFSFLFYKLSGGNSMA